MAANVASTASKAASGVIRPAISASGTMVTVLPACAALGACALRSFMTSPFRGKTPCRLGCHRTTQSQPRNVIVGAGQNASVGLAACRHRPNAFDLTAAHSDEPVMHIAGGVAMARHQLELVIDLENALRV